MKIIHGDCLEEMDKLIAEGIKVDAIITDPPYGITACKWDTVIPFDAMWERLNKLIKPNGAIVLFGSEPFSSALRMSNIKNYKYDWKIRKTKGSNPFVVKYQPHRVIEDILVFSKKTHIYNPQKVFVGIKDNRKTFNYITSKKTSIFGQGTTKRKKDDGWRFPENIIEVYNADKTKSLHPTQKPVALMEYLIKTYTNEGETVLDFTAGSGTTCLAAKNLNRNFIGIEKEQKYVDIANKRLETTTVSLF